MEAISKASIGLKDATDRKVQPREYIYYFEDRTFRSNKGFEPEGRF